MGTGRIYTLQIKDPERWGLPSQAKQKVVWICAKCDHYKKVKFDSERAQVLVVNRHAHFKQSA